MASTVPDFADEDGAGSTENVLESWEDYNEPEESPDIPHTEQHNPKDSLVTKDKPLPDKPLHKMVPLDNNDDDDDDDDSSTSENEGFNLESGVPNSSVDIPDDDDDVVWGLEMTAEDIEKAIQNEENDETSDETLSDLSKAARMKRKILEHVISQIHLQEQNLVDLLSDEQVFWIDGDSLLNFVHKQPTTDWEHHGQFLYLVFLAEKYIQLFVSRGGKPELVFFRDGEMLWKSMEPAVLLARKALVQHFTHNSCIHVYTEFENCWDKHWHQLLSTRLPSFILVSIGDEHDSSGQLGFYLNSLAMACQFQNLAVTSLSSVISIGAKLISLTAVPSQPIVVLAQSLNLTETGLQDVFINIREKSTENANRMTTPVSSNHVEAGLKLLTESWKDICDWRSFLSVCASVHYLKSAQSCSSHGESQQDDLGAHLDIVRVFILHSVLLKYLPLSHRALKLNAGQEQVQQFSPHGSVIVSDCKTVSSDEERVVPLRDDETAQPGAGFPENIPPDKKALSDNVQSFMSQIQLIMCGILDTIDVLSTDESRQESVRCLQLLNPDSLSDLVDGRLFYQLCLIYLHQKAKGEEEPDLSDVIRKEYTQLWLLMKRMAGLQEIASMDSTIDHGNWSDEGTVIRCPVQMADQNVCVLDYDKDPVMEEEPLFPIDNPLVDEFTKDIKSRMVTLSRDDAEKFHLHRQAKEFDELYHWHSLKSLTDEYVRTVENQSLCKKPTTTDPKELRKITRSSQKYRAYMHRYGKSLEGGSLTAYVISSAKSSSKPSKKTKGSSKAAAIIRDNEKRNNQKKFEVETVKWKAVMKEVLPWIDTDTSYKAFSKMEDFFKLCTVDELKLEILIEIVKQSFHIWTEMCKEKAKWPLDMLDRPRCIMYCCQRIYNNYLEFTTKKIKELLSDILSKLGFCDAAQLFNQNPQTVEKSPLNVGKSTQEFQLRLMGHLLERDFPATPDPRVQGFIPDDWQRELLDAVDQKESALIVAPTSSGKTYASYYCMEQVLREDDEGVVVYVAPTKSLVNQVAATVYARFKGKNMPPGRAVFGVFTRDYRQDALNSQVLITVPQCLEILLLSPHQQDWVSKLRYVIFDEVHCLGGEIGAEVWEHLILMIPCPFLALSATIANPHDLHRWMQGAKTFSSEQQCNQTEAIKGKKRMARNGKVHLVIFNERYADLEKQIFVPPSKSPDSDTNNALLPMHPFAVLDVDRLKLKGSFPADLSLSPRESFQLYDAMRIVDKTNSSLQELRPEVFFKEVVFIKRLKVREFEARLKEILLEWLLKEEGEEKVKKIKEQVDKHFTETYNNYLQQWKRSYKSLPEGDKFGADTFVILMNTLRERNMLPALVFCYDRGICEELTFKACRFCAETDRKFNETDDMQKEIKSDLKQGEKLNKKSKQSRDAKKKKRDEPETGHEDMTVSKRNVSVKWTTLTPRDSRLSDKEFNDTVWKVRDGVLCSCLSRGLGYHHAGVDAKGRGAVETLFRNKHVQLVTATGTLALGIHMPCKTVVIFSDSPYVTPLQFRQMSGRAGRRGYDLKGNVVFCGTRYPKIHQLINASMSDLKGNFPISVSLVLRLLLYIAKANKYPEDALISARTLLEHPFFCHDKPHHLHQVKHHFLFSVQFLQHLGLVDFEGRPLEMTGLATHLHYHEPANFLFIQFLQKGLFHSMFKTEKKEKSGRYSEEVMKKLVLVMCHLFTKRRSTRQMVRSGGYNGTVFLPSLPKTFVKARDKYNSMVRSVFGRYLKFVARYVQEEFSGDSTLPISKLEFVPGTTTPVDESPMKSAKLTDKLLGLALSNTACSPFISTTGLSDKELLHKDNLHMLVHSEVYADENVIPVLEGIRNMEGVEVKLNAYAYDFFLHGSSKVLARENCLLSGDVYALLKDFVMTLKTISTSLAEMVQDDKADLVVTAFNQLSEDYDAKFNTAFPRYSF